MTNDEIIDLAEKMGLHFDHEDDPETDESILLWHDADLDAAGGLLVRFRDGQAYVQESRAWCKFNGSQVGLNGYHSGGSGDHVLRSVNDYVDRCAALPRLHREMTDDMTNGPVKPAAVARHDESWRPRTQRKEGGFKAVDPLGHFYYVEIFREMTPEKIMQQTVLLVTADGESVVRVGKGQYRLERARIDLSSDDPAAP